MKRCPKCKAKVRANDTGYKCGRCGWSQYEPQKKDYWDLKWGKWWGV